MKAFSSQVQLDEENTSKLENGKKEIILIKSMKTTSRNITNGKYMNNRLRKQSIQSKRKERIRILRDYS